MKGIVLAGGSGPRLHPITLAMCKQLMPILQPMIIIRFQHLMLAGIREIFEFFQRRMICRILKDIGRWASNCCHFEYKVQHVPNGLAQAFVLELILSSREGGVGPRR